MKGSFWDPPSMVGSFKDFLSRQMLLITSTEDENELLEVVASAISEGKIIGWFQGRMEFGPRALGARSIIGDARNEEMQSKMNLSIKFRESFRPFAPSVMEEHIQDYFDFDSVSPYMLMVAQPVKHNIRNAISDEQLQKMKDLDLLKRVRVKLDPSCGHSC